MILDQDGDPDTPKPVSFTVKETVCPRTSQQPQENCDFKENGLVKQCVGTVTLDQSKDLFDINSSECQENSFLASKFARAMVPSVVPARFPHSTYSQKTVKDCLMSHPLRAFDVKATNFSGGQHRSQTQRVEESKRGVYVYVWLGIHVCTGVTIVTVVSLNACGILTPQEQDLLLGLLLLRLAEVMVTKAASLVPSDRGCSSEWASAPFSFSVLVDFPANVLMPSPSSALCHPVCAAEAVKTVGKRISTRTHSLSLLLLMKLSGVLRWEPLFPTVFLVCYMSGAGCEHGPLLQSSGTLPLSLHPGPAHLITQPQMLRRGAGWMFVVVAGGEIRSRSLAQAEVLGQGGRLASSLALQQQQQRGRPDATKYSGYSVAGTASRGVALPSCQLASFTKPQAWETPAGLRAFQGDITCCSSLLHMKWEVGRKKLTRNRERVLTLSPDPSLHPHSSRGCLPYSLQRAGGRAEFPPLVPVRRPAWW
ncbi:hypothetical protein DBR06_SOUSAS21910061, partial [Sousa chinensis]